MPTVEIKGNPAYLENLKESTAMATQMDLANLQLTIMAEIAQSAERERAQLHALVKKLSDSENKGAGTVPTRGDSGEDVHVFPCGRVGSRCGTHLELFQWISYMRCGNARGYVKKLHLEYFTGAGTQNTWRKSNKVGALVIDWEIHVVPHVAVDSADTRDSLFRNLGAEAQILLLTHGIAFVGPVQQDEPLHADN